MWTGLHDSANKGVGVKTILGQPLGRLERGIRPRIRDVEIEVIGHKTVRYQTPERAQTRPKIGYPVPCLPTHSGTSWESEQGRQGLCLARTRV